MDDRSFDSLARSLASGANRRQILKGVFGLGGAALAGAGLSDTEAARRPTPTPKPPTCPGQQTPVNGQCVCQTPKAPGPEKCGPDCCNPDGSGAAHSECCDNACCYGACYGEELCCPYPREFCAITGECCPDGWTCCPEYGCIAPDKCCTAADCPLQECFAAFCTAEHVCVYGDDCQSGADCCEASTCFRSDCQNDGTCGAEVFDCRRVDPSSTCCDGGVCIRSTGQCCTPLTCAAITAPYTCELQDGCGNLLSCPDACPDGWECEAFSGLCVNQTTICVAPYCSEPNHLGLCANREGFCRTRLDGALICVSDEYPTGSNTGACGDCTSDAACVEGGFCARDAGWVGSCPGCTTNGTGCSIPL